MSVSTNALDLKGLVAPLLDFQPFCGADGNDMYFDEQNFFAPYWTRVQIRATKFFRHLEKKLPMQNRRESPLQIFLKRISQFPHTDKTHIAEMSRAFFKQRGYFLRLFSNESWDEWTENRTALGKVAFLLRDCTESSTKVGSFTERLDERVIQQANEEAKTFLQRIRHRDAIQTTSFQPIRCISGLFGGTAGSLLTMNPLPLAFGCSECFPIVSAQREIGDEFQVTTNTRCNVVLSSIASLENGNFAVLWEKSIDAENIIFNIFGQIFDDKGVKIGNEFQVNTHAKNHSYESASIASFNNSNFVVTWAELTFGGQNLFITDADVFGQLFDENGTKIGSKFQVNTYKKDLQWTSSVTCFSDGKFVVAWASCCQDGSGDGVFSQLFDPDGSKIGKEFQVNTYTRWDQRPSSTITFSNDNFIVIWKDVDGQKAQYFDKHGSKIGSEIQLLNTSFSSVASLEKNKFVITWSEDSVILVQLFYENGTKINNEIRATTSPTEWDFFRGHPSVTGFNNGNFVVVWETKYQDDSGIYVQLFSENGTKIRSEVQVNTYTENFQRVPQVESLKDGNFVVVWVNADQYGKGLRIYAKIFNDLPPFTKPLITLEIALPFVSRISQWFARYGKMIGYISGSALACVFVSCAVFHCIRRKRRKERHYRPLGSYPSLPLGSPARRTHFSASTPRIPSPSPQKRKKEPDVELGPLRHKSPSASLFPHPVRSSSVSSSSSAASLSRGELQTLLENAHLTSKELTELHQALQALAMTPKQIATSLTFVQDWEEELRSVAQREQDSRIKTAEQIELFSHPNPSVGDYYEVLWARISDTLLACKTMHSELIRKDFINKFDRLHRVMDTMSRVSQRTGDILGGEIRYVGATHILSIVLDFFSGPAKERAVQNLSKLVREIREIDTLAEEIARLLTKAKMRQLATMTAGLQTSWKDRLKKRWQTFRASECITEAKKMAMQDAMLIIKAVANDRTGKFQGPNLIDKLVRCVLSGFRRSPDALSGSKTRREAPSSATLSPKEQQEMSERLKRVESQVKVLKQGLAGKEGTLSPEEQRLMSERLTRMESQVKVLKQGLAGKEDKSDDVSGGGTQLLAQSSSHSREKGFRERMETLERIIAELSAVMLSLHEDHVYLAAELGIQLPSDRAPRENPDREELLESEEEDLL